MSTLPVETFCQLISHTGAHPPIELPNGATVSVGRGPATLVTDRKCSRNQLQLTADYASKEVVVACCGSSPSSVGGQLLGRGKTLTLGPSGVIELLEGQHKCHVHFGQRLSEAALECLKDEGDASVGGAVRLEDEQPFAEESEIECSSVPKACMSRSSSEEAPPAKRAKVDCGDAATSEVYSSLAISPGERTKSQQQKSLHSFFKADSHTAPKSKVSPHSSLLKSLTATWREQNGLIILQYGPPILSHCVASFDLDGTLIETASGKRFARDTADWKFTAMAPEKLRQLHSEAYKIVVFTNQLGIAKGKPSKSEFREKVEAIAVRLGVPLLLLASTAEDINRKPSVGLWEHMVEKENGGVSVDMATSVYVGDAAGRLVDWKPGAKKDFSCSDRKFAANLDLTFHTPEEYFLGSKRCTKFTWGDFDPRSLDYSSSKPILEPRDAKLSSDSQEVIIFQGCPASGKTTFFAVYMKPKGYVHVNRDTVGTWQKCVTECERAVKAGKSVVIDNTNPSVEARFRYIEVCKRLGVSFRCFYFTTSISHGRHNNRFRELTTTNDRYKKVSNIAFNTYKSHFIEPSTSEGFSEVVKIEFVPSDFPNEKLQVLYRHFLV